MASAFIGKPPATQDDYWIIKGMLRMVFGPGVPLDPNKGFPLLLQRPANNHYQSRGTRLLIGFSFAIVLIILVTGTRLWLRFSRRELRWGPDDFVIVPGVVSLKSEGENTSAVDPRTDRSLSMVLLPHGHGNICRTWKALLRYNVS